MPSLEIIKSEFSQEAFELLTVDIGESRETVEKFMQENGYTFTVMLDEDKELADKYEVMQHPMKYLIDPDGQIVGIAIGYRKWDSEVAKLLLGKLIRQTGKAGGGKKAEGAINGK